MAPDLNEAGETGFIVSMQINNLETFKSVSIPFEYRYKKIDAADYSQWFAVDTPQSTLPSMAYRQVVLKADIVPSCDPCSGSYYFEFRELNSSGEPVANAGAPVLVSATGLDWEGF